MNEKIEQIRMELIRESKTNPRKTFNPADEKELVESIKASGIVSPLILRPAIDGQNEVVDGARRLRAAKAAGLPEVPAIIRQYTDEEAYEVQLISFAQRVDIHPLDEAAAYEQLRKKKFDVGQIAAKVGKERSYIAKRLQLLSLIDAATKQLQDGKISLDYAIEIARLRPEMQKEALEALRYDLSTLAELREYIQDNLLLNLDSVSFQKGDATLLPKAGPCTSCPKRSGNSPDLFGDISKKGNHCLDRECFTAKTDAFAWSKLAEAEAQGRKLTRITDNYTPRKGIEAIGRKDYSVVGKRDATGEGIYVDGPEAGKVTPIRVEGKKAASGGASSAAPGKKLPKAELQKRFKRRLEIFGNKVEQEARLRIYKPLILRLKWPIDRKDFEIIMLELIDRSDYDSDSVGQATGIKIFDGSGHPALSTKDLAKFSDQQLVQTAFAIVMSQELVKDPLFTPEDSDRMDALCSRHGVDRKKIREEVAKEMEAKKPKPPVAEPKKPTVKKKAKKA